MNDRKALVLLSKSGVGVYERLQVLRTAWEFLPGVNKNHTHHIVSPSVSYKAGTLFQANGAIHSGISSADHAANQPPPPRAERRSVMTCIKLQAVCLCWISVANPVTHMEGVDLGRGRTGNCAWPSCVDIFTMTCAREDAKLILERRFQRNFLNELIHFYLSVAFFSAWSVTSKLLTNLARKTLKHSLTNYCENSHKNTASSLIKEHLEVAQIPCVWNWVIDPSLLSPGAFVAADLIIRRARCQHFVWGLVP